MRSGVATFVLLAAIADPCLAAPPDDVVAQAREHTRRGTAAFNLSQFDEAAREYETAYRLMLDPALLYNIGQSYRLGGHPDKALAAYKAYLRTAPANAPERTKAERRIAELQAAGGDAKVATPAPVRPPAVEPRPPEKPPVAASVAASSPPPADTASDGWLLGRSWAWVAAGSAVALGAAASFTGLSMRSRFDELNGQCGSKSPTRPGCAEGDIESVTKRKTVANVLWGLTAAAAVTAGVLFVVEGHPVEVAPSASMSSVGIAGRTRF
jgi:tetratricopeptide (TPR) repeat protein